MYAWFHEIIPLKRIPEWSLQIFGCDRDFYKAIRYLNIILIKEPHNQEAKFYKRQVMEVLEQMKKKRSKDLISF